MDIEERKDSIKEKIVDFVQKKFGERIWFDFMSMNYFFKPSCDEDEYSSYLENIEIFKYIYDNFSDEGKIYLNNEIVGCLMSSSYDGCVRRMVKNTFTVDEQKFTKEQYAFICECIERGKKHKECVNINESIAGNDILLKPYTENDMEIYVNEFFTYPMEYKLYTGVGSIDTMYAITSLDCLTFSIYDKKSDSMVGFIKLSETHADVYNIEYYTFKQARRKGYGLDAINTLVSAIKNHIVGVPQSTVFDAISTKKIIEHCKIIAVTDKRNIASSKIVEKAMFKKIDIEKDTAYKDIMSLGDAETCNLFVCEI